MHDNEYSSNRQHAFVADPNSQNSAQQRSTANRLNSIPPFPTVFQQAVVREVFFDPTVLDEDRIDELIVKYKLTQLTYIKRLPRMAVLAELVRDGSGPDQPPQIFFPFFPPHITLPIKAGERIWTFKEQGKVADYGYWMCRVTEPRDIDDLNITHGDRKIDLSTKPGDPPTFHNGALIEGKSGPESDSPTASIIGEEKEYEIIIQDSDSGALVEFEAVPRFTPRPGDFALQGTNNARICIGTDRTGAAAEFETKASAPNRKGKRVKGKPKDDAKGGAATIDFVVGSGQEKSKSKPKKVKNSLQNEEIDKSSDQEGEGDPDFDNDLSRIYLTMKSAIDDNFKIKTKGVETVVKKGSEAPGVVVKTDYVRIIARKELRFIIQPTVDTPASDCPTIVMKDKDIIFIPADSGVIKLGAEDADQAIFVSPVTPPAAGGTVTSPPLVTSMGGVFGTGGAAGTFAKKVLIK